VEVHTGGTADAAAAARLHAEQIAEGFLASLGPRFLTHLYRRIALHPSSFLLVATDGGVTVNAGAADDRRAAEDIGVAEDGERCCGFIAGSVDVGGLYRSFLRHDALRATASALPRLVRQWRFALQTLRHGSDGPDGAELLSVAVAPSERGRGIGARLVTAFLTELGRRHVDRAHVVVGASNEPAQALYRGAGFAEDRRFELHPGTTSVLMTWTGDTGEGGPEPTPDSGRPHS
jgi:ribosomal protein S18 acetylase RimI-like enzyme